MTHRDQRKTRGKKDLVYPLFLPSSIRCWRFRYFILSRSFLFYTPFRQLLQLSFQGIGASWCYMSFVLCHRCLTCILFRWALEVWLLNMVIFNISFWDRINESVFWFYHLMLYRLINPFGSPPFILKNLAFSFLKRKVK